MTALCAVWFAALPVTSPEWRKNWGDSAKHSLARVGWPVSASGENHTEQMVDNPYAQFLSLP